MNKTLRILSIALMLIVLITGGAIGAMAAGETDGYNLEDSKLTILKDSAMQGDVAPWYDHRAEITEVTIGTEVTKIGKNAFKDCTALTSIIIPANVKKIEAYAFRNSTIASIHYCGTETEWAAVTSDSKWNFGASEIAISFHGAWVSKDENVHERVCDYCDLTAAHNYDAWVEITPADHLTEGKQTKTCKDCGFTKEEVIAKDPVHTFQYTSVDSTQHKKFCACGEETTEAHAWDAGVVTQEATHTVEGIKTYTCTSCEATKTESIEKTPDCEWVRDEINSIVPTHFEQGRDIFICACGKTYSSDSLPKLEEHVFTEYSKQDANVHIKKCACGHTEDEAHSWNEGEVTKYATHTVKGILTYTCELCGEFKTEDIPTTPEHNAWGAWAPYDGIYHKRECGCTAHYTQYAEHVLDAGTITMDPTHTSSGLKIYKCQTCDYYEEEILPMHADAHTPSDSWVSCNADWHERVCVECGRIVEYQAHNWDDGVIKDGNGATHTSTGIKTYTCKDCGKTKEEVVPKIPDHLFDEDGWEKEDDNIHKRKCTVCADVWDYQVHNWVGEVTEAHTCTTDGTMTYTCTDCGATKTEVIPHGHTFNEWEADNADQHSKTCSACKAEKIYADHVWDEGKEDPAPTHLADGAKVYTCTECGETKSEILPRIEEHEWVASDLDEAQHKKVCVCGAEELEDHSWKVETTEATHLEEGSKVSTCEGCGKVVTEILPKDPVHTFGGECVSHDDNQHSAKCECEEGTIIYVGHQWDDGKITVAPTHTAKGEKVYTCKDCGFEKKEQLLAITSHTYGEWVNHDENQHKQECVCGKDPVYSVHTWGEGEIITEATKDADGEMKYVCSGCGAEKTEIIPKPASAGILSGCGALLSVGGGLLLLALLGSAGVMFKKKKKYSRIIF